jgi:hypothetical protein
MIFALTSTCIGSHDRLSHVEGATWGCIVIQFKDCHAGAVCADGGSGRLRGGGVVQGDGRHQLGAQRAAEDRAVLRAHYIQMAPMHESSIGTIRSTAMVMGASYIFISRMVP